MIDKLVRDKIPEIIRKKGESCEFYITSGEEYLSFLFKKVVEEAEEILNSSNNKELKTEIADLYEVIDTILKEKDIDINEIKEIQKEKNKLRGGFKKKIILTKY